MMMDKAELSHLVVDGLSAQRERKDIFRDVCDNTEMWWGEAERLAF
jgi:hypothetical protein